MLTMIWNKVLLCIVLSLTLYELANAEELQLDVSRIVLDEPQGVEAQAKFIFELQTQMHQRVGPDFNLENLPTHYSNLTDYLALADDLTKIAIGANYDRHGNPIHEVRQGARKLYADYAVNILEQVYSSHTNSYLALAFLGRAYQITGQFSMKIFGFNLHPTTKGAIYLNRAVRKQPENFLIRFLRFVPLNFNPRNFSGEDFNDIIADDFLWLEDKVKTLPKSEISTSLKNVLYFLMARNRFLYSKSESKTEEIISFLGKIENPKKFFQNIENRSYPDITELLKLESYIIDD